MSNKIDFQKELSAIKRANKEARERRAILRGYKNSQEYIAHLQAQIKAGTKSTASSAKTPSTTKKPAAKTVAKTTKQPKKVAAKIYNTIHVVDILDKSGSMHTNDKFVVARKGIALKAAELCKDTAMSYKHTMIVFDWTVNTLYSGVKMSEKNIKKLDSVRPNGSTALNDAIWDIHAQVCQFGKFDLSTEKVLINIYTDGEENSSTRSRAEAAKAIKSLEEKGVLVTFIGTKKDCEAVVRDYKIDETNTLSHNNTEKSLRSAFVANSTATVAYSAKVSKGLDVTRGFYKDIKK